MRNAPAATTSRGRRGKRPFEVQDRPARMTDSDRHWLARFYGQAVTRQSLGPGSARPGQLMARLWPAAETPEGRKVTIEAFRLGEGGTECEGFLSMDLYEDGRNRVTYRREWVLDSFCDGKVVALRPGEYRALLTRAMA